MDKEKCLFFVKEDKIADNLRKIVFKNHYSDKSLGYRVITDGYVLISRKWTNDRHLEGGVVDSNMCYIPETAFMDNSGCSYEFDASNVESAGKCVFLGTLVTVYGHAITDGLKKLWFLNTELGNQLINDPSVDLVYITSENTDTPKWQLKILELAGIDVSRLKQVRNTTKYKEIIIPDNSIFVDKDYEVWYYCNEYREIIERIKDSVRNTSCYESTPSVDLYFTRTAFNNKSFKEIGEKSIEKLFKKRGFQVFSPEKLSIEEQISLLMKCRKFVTTEGSCSHASVFCKSSAEVIILRKANYVNGYTAMIIDSVGHRTVFFDVHHSVRADKRPPRIISVENKKIEVPLTCLGPFYLYAPKELYRFLGIDHYCCPLILRPSYLIYRYFYFLKDNYYRLRAFLGRSQILRESIIYVSDRLH